MKYSAISAPVALSGEVPSQDASNTGAGLHPVFARIVSQFAAAQLLAVQHQDYVQELRSEDMTEPQLELEEVEEVEEPVSPMCRRYSAEYRRAAEEEAAFQVWPNHRREVIQNR